MKDTDDVQADLFLIAYIGAYGILPMPTITHGEGLNNPLVKNLIKHDLAKYGKYDPHQPNLNLWVLTSKGEQILDKTAAHFARQVYGQPDPPVANFDNSALDVLKGLTRDLSAQLRGMRFE
jgi:hypothetical protein